MNNNEERLLDERLAEFTDRVLSKENRAIELEDVSDEELGGLEKTVLRLKSAAEVARAESKANVRIRSLLLAEWGKAQKEKERKTSWQRQGFPRLAFAGGFLALVLLGAAALLLPQNAPLTGAAEGARPWSPLLILAGIAFIVFILWRNRHD